MKASAKPTMRAWRKKIVSQLNFKAADSRKQFWILFAVSFGLSLLMTGLTVVCQRQCRKGAKASCS